MIYYREDDLMKKAKIVSLLALVLVLTSCEARTLPVYNKYRRVNPEEIITPVNDSEINFEELHNDVIDGMLTMKNTFFFIVENGFVISGSNDPKKIEVDLTCIEDVPKEDIEVVFSMALNLIGNYCSQQNFKYEPPTLGKDNVYKDFGTVFNDYALKLYAKDTKDNVIFNENIKAGGKIPVDPQYIMEE